MSVCVARSTRTNQMPCASTGGREAGATGSGGGGCRNDAKFRYIKTRAIAASRVQKESGIEASIGARSAAPGARARLGGRRGRRGAAAAVAETTHHRNSSDRPPRRPAPLPHSLPLPSRRLAAPASARANWGPADAPHQRQPPRASTFGPPHDTPFPSPDSASAWPDRQHFSARTLWGEFGGAGRRKTKNKNDIITFFRYYPPFPAPSRLRPRLSGKKNSLLRGSNPWPCDKLCYGSREKAAKVDERD